MARSLDVQGAVLARPAQRVAAIRGFGLLEAIVAVVILGTSGLVLFSWLGQNLVTASRVKDAEDRARLQLEAVAWLSNLNPAMESDGEQLVGGMRLRWRSTLVEPMRNEVGFGGEFLPQWQLGLYRVDVQASRSDGVAEVLWQQTIVGWRQLGASASATETPLLRQ